MEKKSLAGVDGVITLSEYMKKMVTEIHGVNPGIIRVIPGGVDTDFFKPVEDREAAFEKLGIPTASKVLFCLRRLVPRMGIDNVIRAMERILKSHPDVFLLIGGRGPMEGDLMELARKIDSSGRIRFLGYVAQEDVPVYYGLSTASVVPTRELEGFGLVLLESMACGTPVLATPVGGMPEILRDFRPEWVFEDTSSESMARGIIAFLDSGGGSEDRLSCRKYVLEKYTWKRFVGDFLEFLSDRRGGTEK